MVHSAADASRAAIAIVAVVAIFSVTAARAGELPLDHARIQQALQKNRTAMVLPSFTPDAPERAREVRSLARGRQASPAARSDSVWEGTLIGAAIGGVGGFIWARQICGANDSECFAIAAPVGVLGGAGIGALVGAVADKLHK
jgi:hypothetical protein